jgi:hypothetical protein
MGARRLLALTVTPLRLVGMGSKEGAPISGGDFVGESAVVSSAWRRRPVDDFQDRIDPSILPV